MSTNQMEHSREYEMFMRENRKKQNKYIRILLYICVAIVPLIAVGTGLGIFKHISLRYSVIFFCVLLVLVLIYSVVLALRPSSYIATYIGLFVMLALIFCMSTLHIGIYLSYFFVPFVSLLFLERHIYIISSVAAYIMMMLSAYSISGYNASLRIDCSPMQWFISHGAGYTMEFVVMFTCGLMVNLTIERNLKNHFDGKMMINEQQKNNEKMSNLAHTDTLTGLGNRLALSEELKEYEDKIPNELAIVQLDVNGLKQVNDTYGHAAGDEIVMAAANMIVTTIGDFGTCYRTGGDEFVAVLRINKRNMFAFATRLSAKTDEYMGSYGEKLSISCGYALHEEYPDMNVGELMSEADKQMYEAKKAYYERTETDRRKSR